MKDFVDTRYDGAVVEALVRACDAGEVANGIVRQKARILENALDAAQSKNEDPLELGDDPVIPAIAGDSPLELGL
jgi:hypothetical protein